MANTKAAVLDETIDETEAAEPTNKQIVAEGIDRVLEATGIDVQKNRYKAMRAIAFQAFTEAIESDDFDGLVDRAIANVGELPAGWEIEKPVKEAEPVKAPAKKAAPAPKAAPKAPARRAAAKAPAKAPARKRPTRSA